MSRALIAKSIVILFSLTGCDTTGLPGLDLGSQAENGTLVMGMVGKDDTEFSVIVAPMNEDGSVNSRGGDRMTHKTGKSKSFHALSLKPGTYVFRSVNWGNRLSKYVVCLNNETYAVPIVTSQTVYAGDISFDRASFGYGAASFTGMSDRSLVANSLSADPLISGQIKDAELRPATFAMGRNRLNGNEICGSGSF